MVSPHFVGLLILTCAGTAQAQAVDKYHITPEERAACETDATTFCSSTYPDVDALISCMRSRQQDLSPRCRKVFLAGLHRRRM